MSNVASFSRFIISIFQSKISFVFYFILCFHSSSVFAQGRVTLSWIDINTKTFLSKNHTNQLLFDARFRGGIDYEFQQTHARIGFKKTLSNNFSMVAGTGYFKTHDKEIARSNEYRFHQDFNYSQKHFGQINYLFSARLRFEERLFSDTFFGGDLKTTVRWRLQSQFQFPISISDSYTLDLKIFEELFSNFENNSEDSVIDNNRLGFALKHAFSSTASLQGSYIWEQAFGENMTDFNDTTHILRLSVLLSI